MTTLLPIKHTPSTPTQLPARPTAWERTGMKSWSQWEMAVAVIIVGTLRVEERGSGVLCSLEITGSKADGRARR